MPKIMLVEDDNSLREIYEARLQAEGYETASAGDGEEALAKVASEKPDLIILDVMMPKISGFDTLDILRSTPATKEIKVIMMSALSQTEDKQRAEKLGANKYLVKSQVTLEDIIKTVKEILEKDSTTMDNQNSSNNAQNPMPASDATSPAMTPADAMAPPVDNSSGMGGASPSVDNSASPMGSPTPVDPPSPAMPPADAMAPPVDNSSGMGGASPSVDNSASSMGSPTPSDTASPEPEDPMSQPSLSSDSPVDTSSADPASTTSDSSVPSDPVPLDNPSDAPASVGAQPEPSDSPQPDSNAPDLNPPSPVGSASDSPESGPSASDAQGGNRVINPLTSATPRPSLDELLAQEAAKEGGAGTPPSSPTPDATPPTNGTPA